MYPGYSDGHHAELGYRSDFDNGSFDNCSEVRFGFLAEDSTFTSSLEFSCEDLIAGMDTLIPLDLYVTDASDNSEYCTVYLSIQDNANVCVDDTSRVAAIGGQVYDESGYMIESATVTLSTEREMITTVEGDYAFYNNYKDRSYTIKAQKSDDPLNGITAIDLVFMQRHILGLGLLDSPYKVIAADVNADERVSAQDQVQLRRMILGLQSTFDQTDSWTFVPKDFAPASDVLPWPIEDSIYIESLTRDQMTEDFVGIKIGDASGDAIPNSTFGDIRTNAAIDIEVNDMYPAIGEEVELFFTSRAELLALQFTLDLEGYEVVELRSGRLEMPSDYYAIYEDQLAVVWSEDFEPDTHVVADDRVLFSIVLRSIDGTSVEDGVQLSDDITESIAYTDLEERQGIQIEYVEADREELVLYQNEPNPFNNQTEIGFYLPEAGEVTLTIHDALGRLVYRAVDRYDRGRQSFVVSQQDMIEASGVLLYQIETATDSKSLNMILVD